MDYEQRLWTVEPTSGDDPNVAIIRQEIRSGTDQIVVALQGQVEATAQAAEDTGVATRDQTADLIAALNTNTQAVKEASRKADHFATVLLIVGFMTLIIAFIQLYAMVTVT